MMRCVVLCVAATLVFSAAVVFVHPAANAAGPSAREPAVNFTDAERRLIEQHSPLPPLPDDPTNRFANDAAAAHFGQYLFFDTRLSAGNAVSCATCHDPSHGFAINAPFSDGAGTTQRHAQALWNGAYNRWYYWDGSVDSLWSQALKPMEGADEMNASRLAVAHTIAGEDDLREAYERIFGPLPDLSDPARFPPAGKPRSHKTDNVPAALLDAWQSMSPDDQHTINTIFVNIAKAIAAYERRLVSRDSPFDRFVEGLRRDDARLTRELSPAAQRGLKLFIGEANCRLCHTGPNFTDGEFHSLGLINRDGTLPNDPARYAGSAKVKADPFNAAGRYSDAPDGEAAALLGQLVVTPETWGQYKTPSLRSVALSPPYMHQGQFATLRDVVDFYVTLEGRVQMGHHQETLLQPLRLNGRQRADLVAFLESLTGAPLDEALCRQPPAPLPD